MAKKDFAKTMKAQGNLLLQNQNTSSNQSITDLIAADAVSENKTKDVSIQDKSTSKTSPKIQETSEETEEKQKPKSSVASQTQKGSEKKTAEKKQATKEEKGSSTSGENDGKKQLRSIIETPRKKQRVSYMISDLAYENFLSLTQRYGFRSQNECMNYLLEHINEFIE